MIKIQGVTKHYGKEIVLNNVTVNFESGHIYGLVGPNGCGKTTLMRCICGFTRPTQGYVEVDGKVVGKDIDFPARTGIILETPSFLPHYSGFGNLVILAGISHGIDRKGIETVMKDLCLDPKSRKPVKKYSLGMRQRLGIAQAIMEGAEILILDEPFNGLDKNGIEDIHHLLQRLKAEGRTIILASHSAADIGQACDRVYDMADGKLNLRNMAKSTIAI